MKKKLPESQMKGLRIGWRLKKDRAKPPVETLCPQCNKVFVHPQYGRRRKFCTNKCRGESALGKKLSSKHREKISRGNKGKKLSSEHKAKISKARKGKPLSPKNRRGLIGKHIGIGHTPETRRKISAKLKGAKSYRWKGGITKKYLDIRNGVEIRLWREAIFERDDYTCRSCNRRGVFLNAHHVLSFKDFPQHRTNISNGITLCRKCHRIVHDKKRDYKVKL